MRGTKIKRIKQTLRFAGVNPDARKYQFGPHQFIPHPFIEGAGTWFMGHCKLERYCGRALYQELKRQAT